MRSLVLATVAALVSLATVTQSHARTLVVDNLGGGDVVSFQAGIDSAVASMGESDRIDTLLVRPGFYDEVLNFPFPPCSVSVIGSGIEATVVRSVGRMFLAALEAPAGVGPCTGNQGYWDIQRIAVTDTSTSIFYRQRFRDCLFESVIIGRGTAASSGGRFVRCEFRDDAYFLDVCGFVADSCRFVGGTAHFSQEYLGCSPRLRGCVFENPGDTAVVVYTLGDFETTIEDCHFRNARFGVVGAAIFGGTESVQIFRSKFEDISDTAVRWDAEDCSKCSYVPVGLLVLDSRFERCGRGILWGRTAKTAVSLQRDTLISCDSTAIEVGVRFGEIPFWQGSNTTMDGVIVVGARGDGIVLHHDDPPDAPWMSARTFAIQSCWLRDIGGAGIRIRPTGTASSDIKGFHLMSNRIESTGESGVSVEAQEVVGESNLVIDAGGHGVELRAWGLESELRFERASIIGSGGHGLAVVVPDSASAQLDIENNLVVLGAGDGIRVEGSYGGAVNFNDAWLNYGAAYHGVVPSAINLCSDPIFCDLEGGEFTVSSVSPCRPDGPYGQIGAMGVACSRLAEASAALSPRALVFPNPGQGRVALRSPWLGSATMIEVYDLQGRAVWSTRAPEGVVVHWTGVHSNGKQADAGLYWIRFSQQGRSELRRLAWLR